MGTVVEGSLLQKDTAGAFLAWLPLMRCRANGIEDADYYTAWFSRLDRTQPESTASMEAEVVGEVSSDVEDSESVPGTCFGAYEDFEQTAVMKDGADIKTIKNLVHPTKDTAGRKCMYQCVTWDSFNLQDVLLNTGTIAVGASAVVVLTEWVSTRLGIEVVTESTSPDTLVKLVERMSPDRTMRKLTRPFRMSMFMSAFFVVAIYAIVKWVLVGKLTTDGWYTVDYYTWSLILFCVTLVTSLRCWHPFQCRPQIFTKKIWSEGVDKFVVATSKLEEWNKKYPGMGSKKPEFKKVKDIGDLSLAKIDLYQWMQLTGHERTELLINYCRRPTEGDQGPKSIVMPLAPVEVKLKHKSAAEKVSLEKGVHLEKGDKLEVKKWKSEDLIVVEATIDGKKEIVIVDKDAVIEDSDKWTEAVKKLEGYTSQPSLEEGLLEK